MDVVPFASVALRNVPIPWHVPLREESKGATPRMSREERKLHAIARQFGRPIASATTVDIAARRVAETVESPAFAKALRDLRSLFDFDNIKVRTYFYANNTARVSKVEQMRTVCPPAVFVQLLRLVGVTADEMGVRRALRGLGPLGYPPCHGHGLMASRRDADLPSAGENRRRERDFPLVYGCHGPGLRGLEA